GERAAIPLPMVSRLEEVSVAEIEHAGGHEVVQYRGQIMSLVRVAAALDGVVERTPFSSERVPVVVHAHSGGALGLGVDRMVDVVGDADLVREPSRRPGVLCTSILQQRVTELLDVPKLVELAARRGALAAAEETRATGGSAAVT